MTKKSNGNDPDSRRERLRQLGLYGLLSHWSEIANQPWLEQLLGYEEAERQRRSLERRLRNARIGTFKPLVDFDWNWPTQIDRETIEELFSLEFLAEGVNAVLHGPNGVGKTLLMKNLAHHALLQGHTVRLTTASDMLNDLAAQETTSALSRRLQRYCHPQLLCVDEVGYLSYDSRYADLLFEVVTRRYEAHRSLVLTTNKVFNDWPQVFPNAACVVTLIDRLIHRCELIDLDGESYRRKEAEERAARKAQRRSERKPPTKPKRRPRA
jgi:DNA replication protein DnaC